MSYLSRYDGNKENNRPLGKSVSFSSYGTSVDRSRYTNTRYNRSFSEERSFENGPRRMRAGSVDIDSITREIEERTAARKLKRLSQERELAALRNSDSGKIIFFLLYIIYTHIYSMSITVFRSKIFVFNQN